MNNKPKFDIEKMILNSKIQDEATRVILKDYKDKLIEASDVIQKESIEEKLKEAKNQIFKDIYTYREKYGVSMAEAVDHVYNMWSMYPIK